MQTTKHKLLRLSLQWFTVGITFALGIFAVVYASNLALSELGHKAEWDKLTLSMWNSLVSHVDEKLDKTAVSTTATLWTSDTSVPSQNAVKAYVDTAVGASASSASSCPSEISARQASATIATAAAGCRAMVGWWRLPTVEELSCFLNDASMPGWLETNLLWTRTPHYSTANYWVTLYLSSGVWGNDYHSYSIAYRCVR